MTDDDVKQIRTALETLARYKLPCQGVADAFERMLEEARVKPSEADQRWPLTPPEYVGEHLALGDDRPTLSCRLVAGRSYSLSPGQRDYVRDRFNMTPAKLVKVIEVAVFPGTQLIRMVRLVSEEHVDPRRRRMMTKFTIDRWGEFCDQAKANDDARRESTAVEDDDDDQPAKPGKPKRPKNEVRMEELFNEYGIE
jgi:hypothetical protein